MPLRIFLFVLCIICCGAARAQTPLSPNAGDSVAPAHIIDTSTVAVPEPSAQALAYRRGGIVLWIVDTLLGLAIPLLFLFTGLSAWLSRWAARMSKRRFVSIAMYWTAFVVLSTMITLPIDFYESFVRQHAYGLSDQELGKWIGDAAKGLIMSVVFGGLLIWLPYWLLRRSPRRWWLWTGLGTIPLIFFAIMITPVWIEPMFNDFGPMQDKALEGKILALAQRAGIEGSRVYEVNKSVDTKTLNAYVTGFLSTKRIVLWDTIIKKLDDDELLFVMGHEMGHYVLGHVVQTVFVIILVLMLSLYAMYRTAGGLLRRFGDRWGFTELADIASLPLLFLLLGVYSFIASPLINAYSRYNEHEADRFGLELTRNNHKAATAFVKLQTEDLAIPRPEWILVILRANHPTLGDRIDFANAYHPWRTGGAMKYDEKFVK